MSNCSRDDSISMTHTVSQVGVHVLVVTLRSGFDGIIPTLARQKISKLDGGRGGRS
jgi:hypothetical protein